MDEIFVKVMAYIGHVVKRKKGKALGLFYKTLGFIRSCILGGNEKLSIIEETV